MKVRLKLALNVNTNVIITVRLQDSMSVEPYTSSAGKALLLVL